MEYVSCIVNELGHVVRVCSEMSDSEIEEYLEMHPEYHIRCMEI